MNAETIHDALSMIDDDLIEAVDALRKHHRRRSPARFAALAASLILIAGGVLMISRYPDGITETASPESYTGTTIETGAAGTQDYGGDLTGAIEESVTEEAASLIMGVRYVRGGEMYYSPVGIIGSTSELPASLDGYDDAFFAERELIFIAKYEPSGSIRHEITDLTQLSDGRWQLIGRRIVPEIGTEDEAYWQIYVEIPRGLIGAEDEITVVWED